MAWDSACDRFLHVNVVANPDDWLSWAVDNSVAPEIMAFICVRRRCLIVVEAGTDRATRNAVAVLGAGFRSPIKQGSACRSLAVNGLVGEGVACSSFHTLEEIGTTSAH